MKTSVQIGHRKPLVEKLLLVDGISRAGKFLASNILNGIADVEPVQNSALVEHIPFLHTLGLIEKQTAQELLHLEIDMRCYEMLIGRSYINHRVFDKSSIFNVANHARYLARSTEADGDKALKDFYDRGAYSLFVAHDVLPDIQIFFDTFPSLKIISIARSPVDLAYEWFTRYPMEHWGEEPQYFNIVIEGKGKTLMPWYVHEYSDQYPSMGKMDRVALGIEILFGRYEEVTTKFTPEQKKEILFTSYEDILEKTDRVISAMERFLGKKALPEMPQILTREKLPNPDYVKSAKPKKIAEMKAAASPEWFAKLMALEAKYLETRDKT